MRERDSTYIHARTTAVVILLIMRKGGREGERAKSAREEQEPTEQLREESS